MFLKRLTGRSYSAFFSLDPGYNFNYAKFSVSILAELFELSKKFGAALVNFSKNAPESI